MSWDIKNSEFEIEIDGRPVAYMKRPESLKALPYTTHDSSRGEVYYAAHNLVVGTLLQLDNEGEEPLFVRITRIIWPVPPGEKGFVTEGEPNWDDWDAEQELAKRTPKGCITKQLGRLYVERVNGT